MKVVLFNGSPHERGCTFTALEIISNTLKKEGFETEFFHVAKDNLIGCNACGYCSEKSECITNDIVNVALKKAKEADGLVFGSPVYYASPNGTMIAFMDRFFQAGGNTICAHKPVALAVSARRGGCTSAIDVLLKYPTISQMPVISADYWPIIYGNTREQALEDAEGIYTMKKLGQNLAWILKCIDLGKKAGISVEDSPKKIWTNFIR